MRCHLLMPIRCADTRCFDVDISMSGCARGAVKDYASYAMARGARQRVFMPASTLFD